MIKNNRQQEELIANYYRQKTDFLDSLRPDDFRNGSSFNQAEIIIDQLNEGLYRATIKNENSAEFIQKAAKHLFRENSPMVAQAVNLSEIYLKMKFGNSGGAR